MYNICISYEMSSHFIYSENEEKGHKSCFFGSHVTNVNCFCLDPVSVCGDGIAFCLYSNLQAIGWVLTKFAQILVLFRMVERNE